MFTQMYHILFGMIFLISIANCKLNSFQDPSDDDIEQVEDQRGSTAQFEDELLQAHNRYRARHCVSPLRLDNSLNRLAQNYAEQLAESNGRSQNRPQGLGQNLYMKSTFGAANSIRGVDAASEWYRGSRSYNYGRGGFSMETGSFTQMVWKNSRSLGVGLAYTSDGQTAHVVAFYSPAGNFGNDYEDNVFPDQC
ncbi:hypothetical protein I4U23_025069 [Adineta vaga]|nr:hypothetical protein I4U23_025069 [Adineta vaga]